MHSDAFQCIPMYSNYDNSIVLISISLITGDIGRFFHVLLGCSCILFGEMYFQVFCLFIIGLAVFSLPVVRSPYIFCVLILCQAYVLKIF